MTALAMLCNEFEDYIEERLIEWGNWARKGGGMPRYIGNMEAIQNNGGVFIKGTGIKTLSENKQAEEIDRIIGALKILHPQEAYILHAYYTINDSKEEVASFCRMKVRRFNDLLSRGKMWVESRLSEQLEV